MNLRTDGPRTTLTETESSILDVLDHRLWTGSDIEEALRIDTVEDRIRAYCAINLLRRKGLLESYPSSISGRRVHMITEAGMRVRLANRQHRLETFVALGNG